MTATTLRRAPHAGADATAGHHGPAPHRMHGVGAWLAAGSASSAALADAALFLVISVGTATDRVHIGLRAPAVAEPSAVCPRPADDLSAGAEGPGVQQVLQEIRAKTGLTWAQIARALGVQRRTLHFWAEGRAANSRNTERLMELAQTVNLLDAGDASVTNALLLMPQGAASSHFEQFCLRNEAPEPAELRPLPDQLAPEERERRRAVGPIDRLGTRHDDEGPMVGEYLGTVALPDQPS